MKIVFWFCSFSLSFIFYGTGSTHLTFGDSLSTLPASVQSFQEIFSAKDCQYQFESYATVMFPISDTEEKESNIHYTFTLKLIPSNNNRPLSTNSLLLPYTTLQSTNFNKITSLPATASTIHSENDQMNDKEKSASENANEKEKQSSEDDVTMAAIPRTFAYTLSLLDCSFTKRPFPGIWQLRYVKIKLFVERIQLCYNLSAPFSKTFFKRRETLTSSIYSFSLQHPAADSSPVVHNLEINEVVEQISFEDMHLRLCFTAHINHDQLYDLIKSRPCLLILKGPRNIYATAELDNHNILMREKTKGIVLLEQNDEQIAMAHISVQTQELGLNFNTDTTLKARQQHRNEQSAQMFLDENVAYKMIEELEEWRVVQQKEFLAELKRHEIAHLTQLSNEWQRKRREEELKLQKKIEQCDRLTQTLEEAHIMFKQRNQNDSEYELTLLKTKSDLERCYAKRIDSLNAKIMQIEKESFIQQKNEERILNEVERERDQLKAENRKLKLKIKSMGIQGNQTDMKDQINELKEYVVSLITCVVFCEFLSFCF